MTLKFIRSGSIALLGLGLPALAGTIEKKSETKTEAKLEALTFAKGILTLDLEERLRAEARNNNRDFDSTANDPRDDGWLLNRFRLGLAVKPVNWLKLYAQMQDAREWFSTRGSVPGVNGFDGGNYFDLRQSNLEIGDISQFPLALTVGRQLLNYGDRRLVGDSVWSNLGRTFDGAKLHFQTGEFWVDAFAMHPVQLLTEQIDGSDSDDNFFGLYGSTDALRIQTTDIYIFYRDKTDAQPDLSPTNTADPLGNWNGPAQRTTTIGTRWKSKPGGLYGFDYTAEFAAQFGNVWTGDKSTARLSQHAFATALAGGYTWEKLA